MKTNQQIKTYLGIWEESLQQVINDFEAGKIDFDSYQIIKAQHEGNIHALKYVLENH